MEKAKRRTLDEQIELAQKELEQKEARIKELKQRRRSKADKERTHRLCRRGGLVEKLLPSLIVITDEQFDTFVEEILLSEKAEKLLGELAALTTAETKNAIDMPVANDLHKSEDDTPKHQANSISEVVSEKIVEHPKPEQNNRPAGVVGNSAGNNNAHNGNRHHNNRHNNTHNNNRNHSGSNAGQHRPQHN
ncbi:MAG: DUF3847 domain-containing protein [Oscillospiraceae bacterium]|jgi:hypothetical protein|nr:DUF3847 domain-containing protein [Oscillospiraceae bacterium]